CWSGSPSRGHREGSHRENPSPLRPQAANDDWQEGAALRIIGRTGAVNLKTPRLYAAALLALVTCLVAACASHPPPAGAGGATSAGAAPPAQGGTDWGANPAHAGLDYAPDKRIFAPHKPTVKLPTPSQAPHPLPHIR